MTVYEEDSGRILISLVRAGATVDMNEDIFSLMQQLAWLLYDVRHARRKAKGLSHYGAAILILDHLEDLFSLRCENVSREKILGVLSTEIGNFRSLHRSKRRSRLVRK